jgi:polysaccharide pyruvyl transferase WcaK-like protein
MVDRPKLLVAGYFGANNVGDEAILKSQIRNLSGDFELSILSFNPLETTETYAIKSQKVPSLHNFRATINYLRDLLKSDGLLVGGGGFLANRLQPFSIYNWLFMIYAAKFFDKKVILFSIGCGPFKFGFHMPFIKFVLNKVDYALPRDITSGYHLKQITNGTIPLQITADMAFLLKDLPTKSYSESNGGPNVLFVLCSRFHSKLFWGKENCQRKFYNYLKSMIQLADFIVEELKGKPIFLPFSIEDIEFYLKIKENMKHSDSAILLEYTSDVSKVFSIYLDADLVVASRYHGVLFALMTEKPVLPIIYHHKTFDLIRGQDLPSQQIGLDIEWIDIDINIFSAKEDIKKILKDKKRYSEISKNRKSDLIKMAEKNLTILNKIFFSGKP